jgi:uncharacterized membrane protein
MKDDLLPIGLGLILVGAALTVAFIGFGPPVVLIGILLVLLDRDRIRSSQLVAVLIGGVAGLVAWYLVLPLGCTTTAVPLGSTTVASASCTTLLGVPSPGGLWALIAGSVVGFAAGMFTARRIAKATAQ